MNKGIAVVTGGTRGLGRSISREMVKKGYDVIALYNKNHEAAQKFQAELKHENLAIRIYPVDISDQEQVKQFKSQLQDWGELKVLIHAASRDFHVEPFQSWSTQKIDELFKTNVIGAVNLFQSCFGLLKKTKKPLVISILSSVIQPSLNADFPKGFSGYIVVKSALEALMQSLAREWQKNNISMMNVYAPALATGVFETWPDVMQQMLSAQNKPADPDLIAAQIVNKIENFEFSELGRVYELTF